MIFWQGAGILVLGIYAFVVLGSQVLLDQLFGDMFYESHWAAKTLSAAFAGVLIYWLARQMEKTKKDKVVIEKETGKELVLKQPDTFFFIGMKAWAYIIWGICGFVILIHALHAYF